jgi:ribosomal protein S6--L-glutamate ligase
LHVKADKVLVGWKEHCALPLLNIEKIVAKIDTGAYTSCLHAVNIEPFLHDGHIHVRFQTHPVQFDDAHLLTCEMPTTDYRLVRSSNGQHDWRYVVETTMVLGLNTYTIELTLSDRSPLNFRMLLGREFLSRHCLIDVSKRFCQDKLKKKAQATQE